MSNAIDLNDLLEWEERNGRRSVSLGTMIFHTKRPKELCVGDAVSCAAAGGVVEAATRYDKIIGFVTQPPAADGSVHVSIRQEWRPAVLDNYQPANINFNRSDGRVCHVVKMGRMPKGVLGKHIGRRKKVKRGWGYVFACGEMERRRDKHVGRTQENVTCLACLAK